ncbi:MAG: hypothetical protein MUF45_14165 [Spirosomaceae bacterium]|jgi:hypothetical protein|nr:hypothetical protein [Spirosomataceae bacterium]
MKKYAFTVLTLSLYVCAFANKEDSLIANVGNKAKVVFYAEKREDYDEIAKYDLNKLFREIRKRSEKNFSNTEEITLKEAEDLKNREVNTTVTTKNWLKKMNLNLFVGGSTTQSNGGFVGEYSEIDLPNSIRGTQQRYFTLTGKPSVFVGIGAFWDNKILGKVRSNISIRYGMGIDVINTKVMLKDRTSFSYQSNQGQLTLEQLKDLFSATERKNTDYKTISLSNLYIQFMPSINFFNKKGEKTFNFGVGVKTGINANSLVNTIKAKKHGFNGIYVGTQLFSEYDVIGIPTVIYKQKILQTAFIGNIGYKYLNLFIQIHPNNINIIGEPLKTSGIWSISQKSNLTTYTMGLRLGK